MPINFFDSACKTESNREEFGICDDPAPAINPADIDEDTPAVWISIVRNPSSKQASFYAVDHCVDVRRPDGTQESRCDGILRYDNNLVFVELKERGASGWLSKASDQLEVTYKHFSLNHNISAYSNVEAYACNSLRPYVNLNNSDILQKFKDNTGLILRAQRDIHL